MINASVRQGKITHWSKVSDISAQSFVCLILGSICSCVDITEPFEIVVEVNGKDVKASKKFKTLFDESLVLLHKRIKAFNR